VQAFHTSPLIKEDDDDDEGIIDNNLDMKARVREYNNSGPIITNFNSTDDVILIKSTEPTSSELPILDEENASTGSCQHIFIHMNGRREKKRTPHKA
jgi:hypothetical protein